MQQEQTISPTDNLILESYKNFMDALALYLGEAFELVLHSLINLEHSVIKIVNGFHSGRKEGAPITDLALSMLEKLEKVRDGTGEKKNYATYLSSSKYGKSVKSSTFIIFGTEGRAIGLFCINFYLDSPISSLLHQLSMDTPVEFVTEHFINDSVELINRVLEKVKAEVLADTMVSPSQKNKEIVTRLHYQGIFKLKNAVPLISQELGISKNTVYMHIRALEESGGKRGGMGS